MVWAMRGTPKGFVSLQDFAQKAGVGHWAVRKWIERGHVKAVRVGMGRGMVYVRVADLKKLRPRPIVSSGRATGKRKVRR